MDQYFLMGMISSTRKDNRNVIERRVRKEVMTYVRTYFHNNRKVDKWNKLKDGIVNAENINKFKRLYDRREGESWSPTTIKLPPVCTNG